MGENRKRKSLWDMEDETKHLAGMSEYNSSTMKENHSSFDSGRRREFSASGIASAPKSRDHSGWASWESMDRNTVEPVVDSFYKNRHDNTEAQEIGRGKSYNKNLSPGFDGAEWRKRDHTPEYDWSGSGRYPGRGRSRSRSRSRSGSGSGRRGRSRSRDRGRGRGRSRSRSRSISDVSVRGQTRSRTPIREHRQSGRWSDGRSRHEKLSRTCRDFATGRCRRGSQCRFLHADNISSSGRDRVEDDRAENWRNRPELGHVSRHSDDRGPGSQSRNDAYDPYYEEDEQFRNQSRNAFPCRDFTNGKCRWGDACRFSHHEASGDSYGKGSRNASFGRDIDQHANKNVKPSCKFFAAGKCNRDHCKFSHEGPKLNNLEGRPGEDTSSFSSDKKTKWWSGPSWDDAVKVSDTVKSTGWTETVVANKNIAGETAMGRSDNRLDHSLENESRTWGIPKQNDNCLKRDQQLSLLGGSGSYDVDMGIIEGKENIADKQERIYHDSQLRNEDGILHGYGQNTMQEGHGLAIKTSQQNVFADSPIRQHHQRPVEDNDVNLFGSDALDVVNGSGNAKHPVFFPGQIFNQNGKSLFPGHSSFSNETDRNQHVLFDLNGPQQHKSSPSRLQSQMQNLQNAFKTPEMSELQAPQFVSDAVANVQAAQMTKSPVGITGEQGAPVIDSSAFMAQRFVNEEQQPQVFAGLDTTSSPGRVLSYSDTAHFVPLINTMNVQSNLVTSSLDLLNPMGNGKADIESNHNLASATVSHSVEQKNQMHKERSSPLSTVDPVFGSSTVKPHESPKAKEQEIVSNSEVNGGGQTVVEESKGGQENKHSENVDGHGKFDEGSAMKDDKGMRLFKNSLVEFVKEILKPTWKEGRMSREVHKTIVKKVVDKVTSTIQGDHIPKMQNKVEQYLTASKPKITKLVQAYLERSLKTES
ncbi:zinc finger CCCH domain-containing protein 55 [Forsythia ovata]|uniref:Zinc finger CCCH domain-containing protein 55 n=1 Tax=Forsythia ovata TaxID=205694 RepID=A0ABD1VLX1_9LAMI